MLTDSEFALLAREVKARTGQALARDGGLSIEQRLAPIQRRESFDSVSALIAAARAELSLWGAMADALLPTETRFFRDRALFHALRAEIAPVLLALRPPPGRLRIWSAGCATGQEAFSLAIMMEELRSEGLGGADILATDVSERLLDKARAGLFTQFEVQRGLPIRTLIAHFEKVSELWRVHDRVRATIRFERHNLVSDPAPEGAFDLVLCCNVLSGLDAAARTTAIETIAGACAPEGLLALGAGETIETEAFTPLPNGLFQRNAAWRKAA